MFGTTIWLEHDQEASARANEEPIEQLRDRVRTMEHNLETLRTRLTQVADLRDAQGIREEHRALAPRLTEVEECASVQTLREFMSKIHRLEIPKARNKNKPKRIEETLKTKRKLKNMKMPGRTLKSTQRRNLHFSHLSSRPQSQLKDTKQTTGAATRFSNGIQSAS